MANRLLNDDWQSLLPRFTNTSQGNSKWKKHSVQQGQRENIIYIYLEFIIHICVHPSNPIADFLTVPYSLQWYDSMCLNLGHTLHTNM